MYRRFTTATVAIVLERINRLGVEFDTLQLLSAWTWSEDFDLLQPLRDLAAGLDAVGYKREVGDNCDLLLRSREWH